VVNTSGERVFKATVYALPLPWLGLRDQIEVTVLEVVPAANVTVLWAIVLVSLLSQVYVTVPPGVCAGA
jgi:hypothetical protein